MFMYGMIDTNAYHDLLASHPIWREAFHWIRENVGEKAEGEYEIKGRDMYASITMVETIVSDQGVPESHFKYIDLHYCHKGGEMIAYWPAHGLTIKERNEEKDYALYGGARRGRVLTMRPGSYAIFFPGDAHMPRICDGNHLKTTKVVVKIHQRLLQQE